MITLTGDDALADDDSLCLTSRALSEALRDRLVFIGIVECRRMTLNDQGREMSLVGITRIEMVEDGVYETTGRPRPDRPIEIEELLWVDRVTGSLYRPRDGKCLSSSMLRLVAHPQKRIQERKWQHVIQE